MTNVELFMNRHSVVLWRWLRGREPGVLWESVVVGGIADSSYGDLVLGPSLWTTDSLTGPRLKVSGGSEGDSDYSVSEVGHRGQAVQAHLGGVTLPPLVGLKVEDCSQSFSSRFYFLTWELMAVRAWAFRISLALSLFNILLTLFSIGLSFFFRLELEHRLLMIVLQVTEQREESRQPSNVRKRITPVHSAIDSPLVKLIIDVWLVLARKTSYNLKDSICYFCLWVAPPLLLPTAPYPMPVKYKLINSD